MGRPPEGRTARTERLELRITPEGMAAIDQARGSTSRSAFVRAAIAHEIRRLATGMPTETE